MADDEFRKSLDSNSTDEFDQLCIIIPMDRQDVATYHSLPIDDQGILIEDARNFISVKVQALKTFARRSSQPRTPGPMITHPQQIRSSYTPKIGPHSNVRPPVP